MPHTRPAPLPRRSRRLALWLSVALLPVGGCTSTVGSAGPDAEERSDFGDPLSASLGLERSVLVAPRFTARNSVVSSIALSIAGTERELTLEPRSVRGADFRLFVQADSGALHPVEAPPSRAVRGAVVGSPDSVVTGAWLDDGLHLRVALAPGEVYWLEPVARISPHDAGTYVLYRDEDVMEVPRACGLDDAVHGAIVDPLALQAAPGAGLAVAEIAVDADFEFYEAWGGVDNALARIESIIAGLNAQYEAEVGITHVVSAAVIRASAADPYSSTDPITLLQDELRAEWLANHGDIQRDTVHLFTGKNLDGSTIGIAYVGAVCGSFGFGLSQANFTSNFACITDLTAHELGHNWAAGHCSCPENTMNPSLTCANTFHPTATVPTIESHRDSRSCLDYGDQCPDDPDKLEPGQCGCGVVDADADLDGVADCVDECPTNRDKSDAGQCGCDMPDVHSDGDGVADCADQCPLDSDKLAPGQCGCGAPDTDRDGDGTADCLDACPDDPAAVDPLDCVEPVCGDDTCDAGEQACTCPADCGAAPASELACADGADDDCDALIDCADPDCADAATCAPTCQADGVECTNDGECCSGDCSGPRHRRTCRGGGGQGGGSEQCGLPGSPCSGHGRCCSRECAGPAGARTCQEPSAGVIARAAPDDGEATPVSIHGGCSAIGAESAGATCWPVLLAGLGLAFRRRVRRRGPRAAARHRVGQS